MNKEEKLKIEIEKLKFEMENGKWALEQINHFYLGSLAIMIAIYIPIMLNIKDLTKTILWGGFMLFLLTIIKYFFKKLYEKNSPDIDVNIKKINELYVQLLK